MRMQREHLSALFNRLYDRGDEMFTIDHPIRSEHLFESRSVSTTTVQLSSSRTVISTLQHCRMSAGTT